MTVIVDWNDIRVGDVVRGGDGKDWEVAARSGLRFVLERSGRRPFSKEMTGSVARVSSSDDEVASAIDTFADVLGGEVLHVQEDDEAPACPVDYGQPGALLAHLYIFHGIRVRDVSEDATLTDLAALHKASHDNKGEGFLKHHHRPDYLTVNAERR